MNNIGKEEIYKLEKKPLVTFLVDSYDNGISFGRQSADSLDSSMTYLQLDSGSSYYRPRSRYNLTKEQPLAQLECYLMRLSERGLLHKSHIIFGVGTDPFHPFEGKFDTSIKFLELFKRYTPALLTIQTRSPLIVIALPVLTALGKHVAVTLGLETCDEEAVRRYTSGLPRVAERLKTATALRRFGVEVTLQVAPLLPYGDWQSDATSFATLLSNHADFISVSDLYKQYKLDKRPARCCLVAKKLADDRKFHWLRQDAAAPLISALKIKAAKKLELPVRVQADERQISIFAA